MQSLPVSKRMHNIKFENFLLFKCQNYQDTRPSHLTLGLMKIQSISKNIKVLKIRFSFVEKISSIGKKYKSSK